ncbi:DUF2093 domain-containing protein [Phreatobacter cathodiphilus]|uniref:DUF2093 domain-containing protein n=1 Tax=Phreatobacter cathodiphilus TaxID=1868589 RepID=A0A2S0NFG0_9HYPH|nr:DUF2093 domain-containing protein [Phreatobacter cathodiphilus]AVO46902.1 DUF2093 domain-containing protein [Phreatobacter cathodiphilus]
MLNRLTSGRPNDGEAELRYLDADFRIVRPGTFVRCAVTGQPIPLDDLKYWSVARQEAYSGPPAVLQRLHPERFKTFVAR